MDKNKRRGPLWMCTCGLAYTFVALAYWLTHAILRQMFCAGIFTEERTYIYIYAILACLGANDSFSDTVWLIYLPSELANIDLMIHVICYRLVSRDIDVSEPISVTLYHYTPFPNILRESNRFYLPRKSDEICYFSWRKCASFIILAVHPSILSALITLKSCIDL